VERFAGRFKHQRLHWDAVKSAPGVMWVVFKRIPPRRNCGMKSLYTWSDPGSIPGRSTKAVHLLIVPSTASRGWNNTDEKGQREISLRELL
jgi:hypothetical protein